MNRTDSTSAEPRSGAVPVRGRPLETRMASSRQDEGGTLGRLAWVVVLSSASLIGWAQPATPAQPSPHPGLLVLDTSFSMRRVAPAVQASAFQLVASGAGGRLQAGNALEIWTFSDQTRTRVFPPQVWTPELNQPVAARVAEFVGRQRYENQGRMDKAIADLDRVIRAVPSLTVFLFTDGEDPFRGTPFDAELNAVIHRRFRELRRAKQSFVFILEAREGRWSACAVQTTSEPFTPPATRTETPLAKEPPPKPTAPPSAPPAPKEPEKKEPAVAAPAPVSTPSVAVIQVQPEPRPGTVEKAAPATPAPAVTAVPEEPKPVLRPLPAPPPSAQPSESQSAEPKPALPVAPPVKAETPPPSTPAATSPAEPLVRPSTSEAPALAVSPPPPASVAIPPSRPSAEQVRPAEQPPVRPGPVAAPTTPISALAVAPPQKPLTPAPAPASKAEPAAIPSPAARPPEVAPVSPARPPGRTTPPTAQTATLAPPEAPAGRGLYLGLGGGLLLVGVGLVYWLLRAHRPAPQASLISQSMERDRK